MTGLFCMSNISLKFDILSESITLLSPKSLSLDLASHLCLRNLLFATMAIWCPVSESCIVNNLLFQPRGFLNIIFVRSSSGISHNTHTSTSAIQSMVASTHKSLSLFTVYQELSISLVTSDIKSFLSWITSLCSLLSMLAKLNTASWSSQLIFQSESMACICSSKLGFLCVSTISDVPSAPLKYAIVRLIWACICCKKYIIFFLKNKIY